MLNTPPTKRDVSPPMPPPALNTAAYASSEWFVVSSLIDGDKFLVSEIEKTVTEDDFSDDFMSVAFKAVLNLRRQGFATDKATVSEQFVIAYGDSYKFNPSEAASNASIVYARLRLQEGAGHNKTAIFHANRVRAASKVRAVYRHIGDMFAECAVSLEASAPEMIADELVAKVQQSSMGLSLRYSTGKGGNSLLQDKLEKHQTELWSEYENPHGLITGVHTGFGFLDLMTGGYQPGDYILIVAETSGGKTALAIDSVRKAAKKSRVSSHTFSYEMGDKKLINRMLWGEAQIDSSRYRSKTLTPMEKGHVDAAYRRLHELPPQFLHTDPTYTIADIAAICREAKYRGQCDIIMVDYLQLVPTQTTSANREREVAGISRALKNLAMELQVPVINLSQLNDDGKVRESRAIKQDADIMMRIEIDEASDPNNNGYKSAKLVIEKNRDGAKGDAKLFFFGGQTRFAEETEHYGAF